MAQQLEFENSSNSFPHTDLRKESTVKKLIKEGRTPFLLVYNGEMQMDTAICFIPPGKSKPAETFALSIKDAAKIALIRDRLQREH